MQETVEEKFQEIFGEASDYKGDGLVNPADTVMLVYPDSDTFGNVKLDRFSESPDSFNYATETDEAELWAMTRDGDAGTIYYYDDEYVKKVAEFFGVTPPELQNLAYSDFSYSEFPVMFKKDGVRILLAPYILNS